MRKEDVKIESAAVEGGANFNPWSRIFGDEPKRSEEDVRMSWTLFDRRGFGFPMQKPKSRENEEL